MKKAKWIVSNKFFMITPLLILVVGVVFVYAYTGNKDKQTNQVASQSYPRPKIETADNPATGIKVAAKQPAEKSSEATESTADTAKVVLQVDGMSCSGCISTIKSSLAEYEGIRDIIVNISDGLTEVYYDSRKIKDVNRLASSITASGYPAKVSQIVTADQLREEEAVAASRAKFYIASVGGWDISRTDFDTELAYATNRYKKAYGQNAFSGERGTNVLDSITAQVVSRLINEGIQMQEVQRVGYRVDSKVLDQEFDKFLKQKNIDPEGLKDSLEKNGYPFNYFMKKFENQVLLRHYIEEQVLSGAASDYDKQRQYLAWFNNARALSKVKIYDKKLERLTQKQSAGGGCGSSCKR
jgi:copper chaperone CopZ